jgi:hypothetical protein
MILGEHQAKATMWRRSDDKKEMRLSNRDESAAARF